jgi:hypothetical protein
MTNEHRIKFFKRIPIGLLAEIRVALKESTFMSVTFDSLNAVAGKYPQLQGAGVILIWFWDAKLLIRKAIRIDFSHPLIANTMAEEWLDISIVESSELNLPSPKVSFSVSSAVPGSLQLNSLRFFSKISYERLTEKEEFSSYKHFLPGNALLISSLTVEHDFVNWIILSLKGDQTIIIERGDQIGTFCLYLDDKIKLHQISEEAKNPDWGKVEVIESFLPGLCQKG